MAEIESSKLLVDVGQIKGGYDADLFIEDVEQFICAICSGVCRETQQVSTCGHIFCRSCIGYIISHSGFSLKCPLDNVVISKQQVKDDVFIRRLINSFKVKCVLHERGCEWVGELDCVTKHLLSCSYSTSTSSATSSPIASPLPSCRPSVRSLPRLPSSRTEMPNRTNLQLSLDDEDYTEQIDEVIWGVVSSDNPPPLPPRFTPTTRGPSLPHIGTETSAVTPLDHPWYKEGMSRKEAEQHLLNFRIEGGFVVRPSMTRTSGNYSLSILYERQILHFRVQRKPDNTFILGQNVDMFLPLFLEPGTVIGDLDALTHPEFMQIQNAPYDLLQTGDSDKVSITSNLLTLLSVPISESVYVISISHLSGTLTLTLHFIINRDPYIPTITPGVVYLSIPETAVLGHTVQTFTCYNSSFDLSHVMLVEFYLQEMIGLFKISIGGEVSGYRNTH
ncbi:TNF receptor-associated factor 6 [Oopsacas minuta]|uniref:TNF receptor-associated factor 6 n=1 Tax=Oopsacas minuta TaxID=111878 RepID=A0AAV7JU33_9METZ|nr:TNF receptor-associated factor 6 [Oopsacas minuta]